MGTPYLGEIRLFSFNFPPKGWAFCNGQTLAINQNQAIFSLLGTQFGGNGQTNFQLPNAQGAVLIGQGNGFVVGQVGGEAAHTLSVSEMPAHNHALSGGGTGTVRTPLSTLPGTPGVNARVGTLYGTAGGAALDSNSIAKAGSGQAHNNLMPGTVLNYCIALQGIFPSRS